MLICEYSVIIYIIVLLKVTFLANISNIISDITSLSEYQLKELFNYIGEILPSVHLMEVLMKNLKNHDLAKVNVAPLFL